MAELGRVTLGVQRVADGDTEELLELTELLRGELLELDVDSVEPVSESSGPDQAKGLAVMAGWLVVQLGSIDRLRALLGAVFAWAARTDREVEVNYGGDVLKVSGVTAEQQETIINAWLAQHVPSA
jgi:hypothetical protein